MGQAYRIDAVEFFCGGLTAPIDIKIFFFHAESSGWEVSHIHDPQYNTSRQVAGNWVYEQVEDSRKSLAPVVEFATKESQHWVLKVNCFLNSLPQPVFVQVDNCVGSFMAPDKEQALVTILQVCGSFVDF